MNIQRSTVYLENRVRTASQPQLHLMLIEGALRFGLQAKNLWDDPAESIQVDQFLDRTTDIVEELVHSTSSCKTEVSNQLEEQYAFLYRELAICRLHRDLAKLESCLKLLEYQRETWRMACERLESQSSGAPAAPASVPMPHLPFASAGGFSVEA